MTAPDRPAPDSRSTQAAGQAARYRRRPVSFEVEARQFAKQVDIGELSRWCGGEWFFSPGDGGQVIVFPEDVGDYRALPGDWIVKSPDGEFYQVPEDEFAAKYEAIAAMAERDRYLNALAQAAKHIDSEHAQLRIVARIAKRALEGK